MPRLGWFVWRFVGLVKRKKVRWPMLAIFTITILVLFLRTNSNTDDISSFTDDENFLINTEGCRIPYLEPFHKSISRLVYRTGIKTCPGLPSLTYTDGVFLRINRTALRSFYNDSLDDCMYESIQRPDEPSDDVYEYRRPVRFKNDIEMNDEFARVTCYSNQGEMLYANFHPFILPKRTKTTPANAGKGRFNVLLIGVDSVSRLNFYRQMPRTRKLLEKLKTVDLKGFNKVADNTFVNLSPMFAGRFVEELPWDEIRSDEPMDEKPFIWKNFSSSGYKTLFAEDAPEIAIFNYMKAGFYKPPMDYYLRPFSLAMEEHGSLWSEDHNCFGNKLETNIVLDWVKDFVSECKRSRELYFSFAFITRLTHDNINQVGGADEPYYSFFKSLQDSNALDDTIFFFFSDHGMRFGPIRETYIGKMEERLPFMYIYLPPIFRARYPEEFTALQVNGNRLTTPFDIHETLKHILHLQGEESLGPGFHPHRASSLMKEIPSSRTCTDAAILPHWCTCHESKQLSPSNPEVIKAASFAVDSINEMLSVHQGRCEYLLLETIQDATKVIANDQVLRFRDSVNNVIGREVKYGEKVGAIADYSVIMRVQPSGGVFEATVRLSPGGQLELMGEVSRINRFGDQSHCIELASHKKYCYCEEQLQ